MTLSNTPVNPVLRFTPYAWSKVLFMQAKTDCEISGFGISAHTNPLLVIDFYLIDQVGSSIGTEFGDTGLADYYENMIDLGYQPCEFSRIWIHTHPGMPTTPSATDETTMEEVFSDCSWSIMCIVSEDDVSCRLTVGVQPQIHVSIKCNVDFLSDYKAPDYESWKDEFDTNFVEEPLVVVSTSKAKDFVTPHSGLNDTAGSDYCIEAWENLDDVAERYQLGTANYQELEIALEAIEPHERTWYIEHLKQEGVLLPYDYE